MLTNDYILTHTPRQIADENTLEEIESWESLVSSEFDGSNGGDIYGSEVSPGDMADDIVSTADCKAMIDDWYADTPEEERPDPNDLKFAYHIMTAAYLKRCEE